MRLDTQRLKYKQLYDGSTVLNYVGNRDGRLIFSYTVNGSTEEIDLTYNDLIGYTDY